jgi:hypothetical protein
MSKKNGHKAEAKVAKVESTTTKKTDAVKETPSTTTTKPTTKGKPPVEEKASGRTAYGHALGAQSGQIDLLLEKGGTLEEIAGKIGSSEGRVKSHMKHLREDLKITVTEKDGLFKIAKKG